MLLGKGVIAKWAVESMIKLWLGLRKKKYFYIKYIVVLEILWFTAAFAPAQSDAFRCDHKAVTDLEET